MAAQTIPAPEIAIVRQSQDLATQALAVKVANNEQRVTAAEMGMALALMEKKVSEAFDPICDAAHKAWKAATSKRASFLDPLTTAKRHLSAAIGGFDQEQERLRRAVEQRLLHEQRAREAKEAERLRREAEDRQLAEALAATEIGDDDLAEAIVSAAPVVELPPPAPVIVPTKVQAVAGASTRTTWKFRIVNAALIPREYLAVDEAKIGGVVRAMKEAANIPGIEAYPDATTSFRG
jgi:hypothetical protein